MQNLRISSHSIGKMALGAVRQAREQESMRARSLREYEFRNNVLAAQTNHDPELILSGPAGTSKTVGLLHKVNREMWRYPRLRVLFIRLVRAALAESALATFEIDILGEDNPIAVNQKRQGRDVYRYPNGSIAVIGGLDQMGRWNGTFWDLIYVCQAEELTEEQWEMLLQRKARDGKYPHPQLMADVNPDRADHWIVQRAAAGKLTLLPTTHADNPLYYDERTGGYTEVGRQYILGTLGSLSGIRRDRYLLGLWKSAEGAIYEEFDAGLHVIDPFPIPSYWPRYRVVDFGFTNPFVCLWFAVDPDGRTYMYREIYMSQRLVEDHAKDIIRHSEGEKIAATIRDHDAEDGATLERHGVPTVPAIKDVSPGIQAVQARFRKAGDGKPRTFFFRDARVELDPILADKKLPTCTVEEIGGYIWNDRVRKEEPVKRDDHGLDCLRYFTMYLDAPKKLSAARVMLPNVYKPGNRYRLGRR